MSEKTFSFLALLMAAVSAALVWFSTLQGPGTTPDSLQYLFAAQGIVAGESVFALSRHWPPGYPLLITLPLSLGWDPAEALRALHTVVAFLNVMLFAACVRPFSGGPTAVSILAVMSFALAPGVLGVSIMAWSETPFLAWLMSALLALRHYLVGSSRLPIGIAAVCLGGALLTRYSGIAFIGVVSAWLVLVSWKTARMRAWSHAVALVVGSAIPLAVWLLLAPSTGTETAPRAFVFHPVDASRLLHALGVIGEWFQSRVLGAGSALVVGVASLCLCSCAFWSAEAPKAERRFIGLCLAAAFGYAGFLLLSISFFDFYTPLDLRILWPGLVVFGVGVGVSAGRVAKSGTGLFALATCVFVVPLGAGLPELTRSVSAYLGGIPGYFNPALRKMPILGVVRDIDEIVIYSNAPELLRLSEGRAAEMLPAFHDMVRDQPIAGFEAGMHSLMEEVNSGRAAVVYFNAFAWRRYLPTLAKFEQLGSATPSYEGYDGWVLSTAVAEDPPQGIKRRK